MRVLVWGINYAPEVTGIAPCNVALCEHLRAAGHDAHMLTTFPYYPSWTKRPEDVGKWFRTDVIHGVPVHRCWHYVPRKVSSLKRIAHEGSFVAASFARSLRLGRFDAAVVVSPPLLLGAAAWLRGVPFVFHVQDLQPDAAVSLGMLKRNAFTRLLYRLEAFAYAKAARVSGISQGMLRAFAAKGVPKEKCVYFPNGTTLSHLGTLPPGGPWRTRHGFSPDDFLAVYSGNLGVKQGLDILLAAAPLIRERRVRIVVCGQGALGGRIQEESERLQLPNLTVLPLQNDEDYREMMADTDIALITQQSGTGQHFFPSKLLSALGFERPVLAVADADSELSLALEAGRFGILAPPGDAAALAGALDRAAALDRVELRVLGEAGRRYVERFAWANVLTDFERMLRTLGTGR